MDAGEVIDLSAAAGLDAARLNILSEAFLDRVSALEYKNLALETLRKLLNDWNQDQRADQPRVGAEVLRRWFRERTA